MPVTCFMCAIRLTKTCNLIYRNDSGVSEVTKAFCLKEQDNYVSIIDQINIYRCHNHHCT